jgi:sulfate adenylyltransferase subunit 2
MREVVAETENPVMLYSIGKDSAVMLHLALKAFYPAKPALPADARGHALEVQRHVRLPRRDDGRDGHGADRAHERRRRGAGREPLHARLGAAHRDHEDRGAEAGARQARLRRRVRRRAPRRGEVARQGRIFSFRTAQHRWDPKNQRPELWKLYNTRKRKGESIRVFPLSNWTELDIWQYIWLHNVPIVPLYFAPSARWWSATARSSWWTTTACR